MKISVIFYLMVSAAAAQTGVATNPMLNVLYKGIENPVTVVLSGCSCADLVVQYDSCIASGEGCEFMIRPYTIGEFRIKYHCRQKPGMQFSSTFRVKRIPDPVLKGFLGKDSVSKNDLPGIKYVICGLTGFDYDLKYQVKSYRCRITRLDQMIYYFEGKGGLITAEISNTFLSLLPGETVEFCDVEASGPDGEIHKVTPNKFVIK